MMNVLLVLGLLAAASWFLVPFVLRRRAEARLRDATRGSLVLSYDDGPGAGLTSSLLDLFDKEGLKATFFMIGEEARARPERIADVLSRGHEVGSHTEVHTNAWKVSPWRAIRDMRAGRKTIADFGGDGDLFRPPYGKMTVGTLVAARGWRLAWWSVDPRDSWAPRPIGDVLAEVEAGQGGVVLMHDFDRPRREVVSPGDHHGYVLELTVGLIALARDKGWAIRTVGEVIADGRDV